MIYRIWDRQTKRFVKNGASLHCFSNWQIGAFNGEVSDFVAMIDGAREPAFLQTINPAFFFDEANSIKKANRYIEQPFTTLSDKEKKYIYQGDIIYDTDDDAYYEVTFYLGMFCIYFPSDGTYAPLKDYCRESLVAGNIFENPELVQKIYANK